MAADFMANAKKSMSAMQLQRHIGTNYETAWFLFHRLREYTPTPHEAGPLGGEGKIVEADTTFIGGKEKNKHRSKRLGRSMGNRGKVPVHALAERGGGVRSHHVANVNGKTLRPTLFRHVDRKSALMTDTVGEYFHLGKAFARQETVNHETDEYVRGEAYTNTVEGFFAPLSPGIRLAAFQPLFVRHGKGRRAACRRKWQASALSSA
jgi:hypothetical protein